MSKPWETKKEEVTLPEIKSDVQAVQPEKATSPTVLLSQADAYIHERIKSQVKTREELDVKIEEKFDANHHRLTLPKELDKFMKKYAFHWIFKKEQAISEACDVKGWVIVNKTHFPELPNHLFSVTGCIERGDLLLGFMKLERAERMRAEPGIRSREEIKARLGAHKGNPDFYVPSAAGEDTDGDSKVIGL